MQCSSVKTQLDQLITATDSALSQPLVAHLEECEDCRAYAEDLHLSAQLKALPVTPMREGFTRRALDNAWAAGQQQTVSPAGSPKWWSASAAALLVVGVMLGSPWRNTSTPESVPPMPVVAVVPSTVHPVDLLMVSGKALPNATITLSMDENVTLDGYSGSQSIRWQAPIQAGNNQLTLPVKVNQSGGGVIVVEVESEGARKQMRFAIQADSEGKPVAMLI